MTDLDKVHVTISKTPMMMVADRLPVGVSDSPVEATVEFKRQNIVTITASEEMLFNIEHWMGRNVSTGRSERHGWRLAGADAETQSKFAGDEFFMLLYGLKAHSFVDPIRTNELTYKGFPIMPPSIVWRYGSDDDVCLLRMRWEGATQ